MNSLDIVVAFGDGMFGAAVGALTAFEFVGLLVITTTVMQIITRASSNFTTFPFGLSGSHTGGPVAGAAVTAYATKKGKLGPGHDITAGLSGLAAYGVLLVDGVFGAVGHVITWRLNQIPAFPSGNIWTDAMALTMVISGVVLCLVFSKTDLFGKSEQGIRHRYSPQDKRWIPYHSHVPQLSVSGLGIGLMVGFLGLGFGGNGAPLVPGISAFSLIFLHFDTQVPVLYHISLPIALVAVPSGSLIWAAIAGIICAILDELISRTSLVHGDTYTDPPAMIITIMTTMINLLATTGLFTSVPLFQSRHNKKSTMSTC